MSSKDEQTTKILIVDDNEQNLELIQVYLEDLDCEILSAVDGEHALEMVREHGPDLVLLDVMMPRMSGYEVCKRLKSREETAGIPIIMVTALSEFGDIERAVECGTDDFLSKPVNKLELLTRVKTMLKLKSVTDRLEKTLAYLSELEKKVASSNQG